MSVVDLLIGGIDHLPIAIDHSKRISEIYATYLSGEDTDENAKIFDESLSKEREAFKQQLSQYLNNQGLTP